MVSRTTWPQTSKLRRIVPEEPSIFLKTLSPEMWSGFKQILISLSFSFSSLSPGTWARIRFRLFHARLSEGSPPSRTCKCSSLISPGNRSPPWHLFARFYEAKKAFGKLSFPLKQARQGVILSTSNETAFNESCVLFQRQITEMKDNNLSRWKKKMFKSNVLGGLHVRPSNHLS